MEDKGEGKGGQWADNIFVFILTHRSLIGK